MFISKRTVLLAAALAIGFMSSTAIAAENPIVNYVVESARPVLEKMPASHYEYIQKHRSISAVPIVRAHNYMLAGGPVPYAVVIDAYMKPVKALQDKLGVSTRTLWLIGHNEFTQRMIHEVGWRN